MRGEHDIESWSASWSPECGECGRPVHGDPYTRTHCIDCFTPLGTLEEFICPKCERMAEDDERRLWATLSGPENRLGPRDARLREGLVAVLLKATGGKRGE